MKALSLQAPGRVSVIDLPPPAPAAGEVLVRVGRVGLCGTDLSSFLGCNPLVTYPRVIGHEVAGVIEAVAPDVPSRWQPGMPVALSPYRNCGACRACALGRPNACRRNETMGVQRDGALAELACIPAGRLFTSPSLSLDRLALAEPFAIGLHAVRRGRVAAGEWVAVIGCGGVGAGAIAAAASRQARVIAVDVDESKLTRARALGAGACLDSRTADVRDRVATITGGEGPAVVIEAVGQPATYRLALELVASCGRIVCVGWTKGDVPIQASHIVAKELEILGSRNATDEMAEVIALFESGRVDPLQLVTHTVPLADAPAMLARWAADPAAVGKILVSV